MDWIKQLLDTVQQWRMSSERRKPRQAHLESLKLELLAARTREAELLKLLAEKDAQIRLVLEERFYRPTLAGNQAPAQAPMFDPAMLEDVTVFDETADKLAAEASR